MSANSATTTFAPFDDAYRIDPMAAMQGSPAVFYHEPLHCFVVSRYADARAVLSDFETFGSDAYKATPIGPDLREQVPEEAERAAQVIIGGQILNMDPPKHTRQRKTAQKTFTRGRVEATKPEIAAIADDLIDEFADRGECDLMQEFAYRLTLRVVGGLLGIEGEDLQRFNAWIPDVFGLMAPVDTPPGVYMHGPEATAASYTRMQDSYAFFSEFVAQRRLNPGEDLASAMLMLTDEDGEPVLSDDDVLAHMVGITAAGTDTTANLIGNIVRYLTESPETRARVLADPALWAAAAEEGLRRSSIAPHLFRLVLKDTEIGGVEIPARSMVCINTAAANGDPDVFEDPLEFDIDRSNVSDHLGLGIARHFCLGAPLARPEAAIALEVLYKRLPDLVADLDQQLEFVPALTVRAFLHQRCTWTKP